jgi:hypothetical protein
MTLTVQNPKEIKNGNGSTTVFSFTFVLNQSSDLVVTHTDAAGVETTVTAGTGTTNYSISLPTTPGNGSITYPATLGTELATGATLTLQRIVDLDQDTDLVNQGAWNPSQVEDALDYSRMIDLQQQGKLDRSIKIPVSDSTGTTVDLPTETLRANKAIVFDSDGNAGVSTDDYEDQVATVAASAAAASTSASAASTSASAASTSAAAAAASYDNFDDRYLGTKSSDPTLDNDGDALVDGALYFNTTNNVLMVYDLGGTTWNRTTPTSSDQTKINTVSGIASNVTTVAGISGNVTTVAGISGNVTTVAGISSDVTAVAADATDIGAVAAKATEIGRLGTADAVADMAILGTADVVTDMNVLATADVVTDMNTLGTADVVADMNVLATADVVTDMNTLGTADVVTDMNTLGTADVVADMNTLGTADVVTDMNTLATGANVTAMGLLGNSTTVTNMGLLGTSAVVTDMGLLGTADVVSDMNTLATADVVADMNTLGTADIVTDMNTLGTAGNVTAMATCATNVADINRYSDEYTISASAPGSPSEGDLWYDSSANVLKVHNGTSFVAVTSATAGIMDVVDDTSPQLGNNLDTQAYTLSNVSLSQNGVFANPNTITADATVTTAALKNMFMMGMISVNDTYTWTIAGDGVLTII